VCCSLISSPITRGGSSALSSHSASAYSQQLVLLSLNSVNYRSLFAANRIIFYFPNFGWIFWEQSADLSVCDVGPADVEEVQQLLHFDY
jgi:hypothetical protein